jgi:SAM-dependent methyltransferase
MINPAEMANIARAEESLWWFRGMREISFAMLDPLVAWGGLRRILEAGCGTGFFAAALEQRYRIPVFAVDLEAEAIRYCRQRGAPHPARASIVSLPFGDEAFDLVASLDVLPHFPPGEEAAPFAELVRVLRPQGILFVRVAALRVFRSRHSGYVWERQRFTRRRLADLAHAHRLRILRLTYANFLLTPVAFLKFRLWEPLTRQPPSSGVRSVSPFLDRLLYAPLALERAWLRKGLCFPWGQSLFLAAQKQ